MASYVRGFVVSSLVWFVIAGLLGLTMAFWPSHIAWLQAAHAHAFLAGFVSMMIFGVGYHALPRFAGQPLRSDRLARIHLWVWNVGLALMVVGWNVRSMWYGEGTLLIQAGGVATAVGGAAFVYNVLQTIRPGVPVRTQ